MKNKGLIITLIVLLLMIIIMLIGFLVVCLDSRVEFTKGFITIGTKKSDTIVLDEKYDDQDITTIEVLQDAGDITFEKTEEDEIRVIAYGKNKEDVEVVLENHKLKIDYTHYRQGFSFFNFQNDRNDIIIYLPSDYANDIKINNDYGNCRITDLENANIKIDCDAGNVELGKIKNTTIKCDYGNIEIDEILNQCDIKADYRKY